MRTNFKEIQFEFWQFQSYLSAEIPHNYFIGIGDVGKIDLRQIVGNGEKILTTLVS